MINGFKAHTVVHITTTDYTTFEGNMYDMVLYYSTYTYNLRKLFTTKYVMVLGNYILLVAVR